MVDGATAQPVATMRDRILKATILRFARHSYEAATLRNIATDVAV